MRIAMKRGADLSEYFNCTLVRATAMLIRRPNEGCQSQVSTRFWAHVRASRRTSERTPTPVQDVLTMKQGAITPRKSSLTGYGVKVTIRRVVGVSN